MKMGLRQSDMAKIIGYSRSAYTNMENGKERYSPLTHLDEILSIFGSYANNPPYKFADYTNRKLLLYMCMFGVPHATVKQTFGIDTSTLRVWLWECKTKYLLPYMHEIDELFPEKDKVSALKLEIIQKGQVYIKCEDGNRIFLNVVPEHIKRIYEKVQYLL